MAQENLTPAQLENLRLLRQMETAREGRSSAPSVLGGGPPSAEELPVWTGGGEESEQGLLTQSITGQLPPPPERRFRESAADWMTDPGGLQATALESIGPAAAYAAGYKKKKGKKKNA